MANLCFGDGFGEKEAEFRQPRVRLRASFSEAGYTDIVVSLKKHVRTPQKKGLVRRLWREVSEVMPRGGGNRRNGRVVRRRKTAAETLGMEHPVGSSLPSF